MIEVFADRVEISNPGGLPSGLKPEEFGTRSVARNPLIASLLHRIDYIEKIGTGISRIRQAVANHQGMDVDIRFNDFFSVRFQAKTKPPAGGQSGVQVTGQVTGQVPGQVTGQVQRLLQVIRGEMGRKELMEALGLSGRANFEKLYLQPALAAELLEMTIPDKPNSRLQKYCLTGKGRALLIQEGDND